MNQNFNYGNVNSSYSTPTPVAPTTTNNNTMKLVMYILMAVAVIGCFLPYLSIDAFGFKDSVNYIYEEGEILDGIYLVAMIVIAFSTTLKGGYNKAIPFLAIATGIFVYDWIDVQSTIEEMGVYSEYVSYGIGYWMIIIGTVGSLILCCLLKKAEPSTVVAGNAVTNVTNVYQQPQPIQNQYTMPQPMVQPMPQAPVNCSYCGAAKNEGAFCKSCGGKY